MSFTTNNTSVAGLGAYTQSIYPQTEDVHYRQKNIRFEIENVENGYVLRYGTDGLAARTFICATPQELADRIIASMVTNKIEK